MTRPGGAAAKEEADTDPGTTVNPDLSKGFQWQEERDSLL